MAVSHHVLNIEFRHLRRWFVRPLRGFCSAKICFQPIVKKGTALSKDPNVVQSQEEEDQIVKAIELSLKETSGSPRSTAAASASLYPSTNLGALPSAAPAKEPRKVRALYNFEAAEDNELTFNSGEISEYFSGVVATKCRVYF